MFSSYLPYFDKRFDIFGTSGLGSPAHEMLSCIDFCWITYAFSV